MPDRRNSPFARRTSRERRVRFWDRRRHAGPLRILWISLEDLLPRLLYFL
ncbi:hypothetical protein [Geothrix sp. 21YS21S-2]|nr:hypothetical protein [Geothrix sp. 21YS21S-2]